MKTLIIARHGNTFAPGQTPTRVGAKTDLELVEEQRGRAIGQYLLSKGLNITRILAAPLKRTMGTAALAAQELGSPCTVTPDERFLEVDYGIDENLCEEAVEQQLGQRISAQEGLNPDDLTPEELQLKGKSAIEAWNSAAIVPLGWKVNVSQIQHNWMELTDEIAEGETLLCVSSNGTIRFAPCITGDYDSFCHQHDIKVATGAVSIFTKEGDGAWICQEWGTKAHKLV